MVEQTLLQDGDVLLTTSIFRVGGRSYPIRNISMVEVTADRPSRAGGIIAVFVGLLSVGIAFTGEWTPQSGTLATIGGVLLVAGAISLALARTTYAVVIATSGGQVQALRSRDFARCHRVSTALTQAIAQAR